MVRSQLAFPLGGKGGAGIAPRRNEGLPLLFGGKLNTSSVLRLTASDSFPSRGSQGNKEKILQPTASE